MDWQQEEDYSKINEKKTSMMIMKKKITIRSVQKDFYGCIGSKKLEINWKEWYKRKSKRPAMKRLRLDEHRNLSNQLIIAKPPESNSEQRDRIYQTNNRCKLLRLHRSPPLPFFFFSIYLLTTPFSLSFSAYQPCFKLLSLSTSRFLKRGRGWVCYVFLLWWGSGIYKKIKHLVGPIEKGVDP